jgi:hypothetical protein
VQPPSNPIIVKVIETPTQETTIVDVVVGSLGLTMVLILSALVLGAILGGLLIGVKLLRTRYNLDPAPDSETLRVTPP